MTNELDTLRPVISRLSNLAYNISQPNWPKFRGDELPKIRADVRAFDKEWPKLLKRHEALLAVEKAAREVREFDISPGPAVLTECSRLCRNLDAALAAYAVLDAGKGEG